MMSEEDHIENGHINDQGEEEVIDKLATADINSPKHSVTTPQEDAMEYFDQKVRGSESGSEESSPRILDKDDVSHHSRSYVTVSPSVSPVSVETNLVREDLHSGFEYDPDDIVNSKPHPQPKFLESPDRIGGSKVEDETQDRDLKISVTERERVGVKSDAYVHYRVCTMTSRPGRQFEKTSYVVWRRYRDFEWLREMLEKHRCTLIIPPLPGKQLTRYFDQKSEDFLKERERGLDKFLKRLAAHPYFSFDKHLKVFITAEPDEFSSYMAETSGSNRLLGAVTSSVKMAANTFRLKNPDPEFAAEAKYFEELGEKLGLIERVASRLHSEREELLSHLEDQSSVFFQWAMNEPQLVDIVRSTSSCMENCTDTLKTLNGNNSYSLMLDAKEYQLFCASGVSAVRRRDGLQLEREKAAEEREKRKKIHDDAANANKLLKLPKLADDLQKAGVEAERTLDDLSIANEQLRVDIEKWREAKDKEMSNFVTTSADNHINYHQQCFDAWEKVLLMLRDPKSPPTVEKALEERSYPSRIRDETTPRTVDDDLEKQDSVT